MLGTDLLEGTYSLQQLHHMLLPDAPELLLLFTTRITPALRHLYSASREGVNCL